MSNSWKMKCIKTSCKEILTEGKIYEVINGYFTLDNGNISSYYHTFKGFCACNVNERFELAADAADEIDNIKNIFNFLEVGYLVVRRNGSRAIVLPTEEGLVLYSCKEGKYACKISDYFLNGRKHPSCTSPTDIIRVYGLGKERCDSDTAEREIVWDCYEIEDAAIAKIQAEISKLQKEILKIQKEGLVI